MNQAENKTILITGTSSGFGLLTAARLVAAGHIVYATMRDVSKKEKLLAEVERRGRGAELYVLPLDVTQPETIKACVNSIIQQPKNIDVLINNAGYGIGGFFEDLTDEEIRLQMETNFFGVQNVCRAVIPHMRARGKGKIINISSIAGIQATPAFGAYNASKWALEGFSESLRYELALFGIDVLLVEPGTYKTKIFHENSQYAKHFSNAQSPYYFFSKHLQKKIIEFVERSSKNPEDIAKLVEKLIDSPKPKFRNFPDKEARALFFLKKILPFRVYSRLVGQVLFSGMKEES